MSLANGAAMQRLALGLYNVPRDQVKAIICMPHMSYAKGQSDVVGLDFTLTMQGCHRCGLEGRLTSL